MSQLSSENLPLFLDVEEYLKDLGMSVIILLFSRSVYVFSETRGREQKLEFRNYTVGGLRLFLIS